MSVRTTAFCLPAVLLAAVPAAAQVLRVPSQHPTIAGALSAAAPGTTILVAAGTYPGRLVWPSVDGIRLVAEGGASLTVIDGAGAAPVVEFGGGLTRATVVEGFTIRGGLSQVQRNYGAGIAIDGSSPTIRDNRITDNDGDGTYWNYGGAIYVSGTGANPLLVGNEIDDNELRNGSWNYGAGIFVDTGASAEIVGNRIHGNRNLTVASTSTGRGHGAGVYSRGTVLVAGNLIAGNLNNTSGWNYGGGVAIAGGTATLLHNTIAGNTVLGGSWQYGGGVHVSGAVTVTMRGNIVASNQGAGVYVASGTTGTIDCDFDDVWSNAPADYVNATPGPGSISVDPLFVGGGDYHLTAASPCLDALSGMFLVPAADVDMDGDPRQIDGDLDGGAGNGARPDMGADEFTGARLALSGSPQIGSTVLWSPSAAQPSIWFLAVAFGRANGFFAPYGNFLLDGSAALVGLGATPGAAPFSIPNDAGVRGVTVLGQALVIPVGTTVAGQFTNVASMTAF